MSSQRRSRATRCTGPPVKQIGRMIRNINNRDDVETHGFVEATVEVIGSGIVRLAIVVAAIVFIDIIGRRHMHNINLKKEQDWYIVPTASKLAASPFEGQCLPKKKKTPHQYDRLYSQKEKANSLSSETSLGKSLAFTNCVGNSLIKSSAPVDTFPFLATRLVRVRDI